MPGPLLNQHAYSYIGNPVLGVSDPSCRSLHPHGGWGLPKGFVFLSISPPRALFPPAADPMSM